MVNLSWAGWVIKEIISIGTQVLFHLLAATVLIHCSEVSKVKVDILPRSFVCASEIRHRNQLTAKAWEKAIEKQGKFAHTSTADSSPVVSYILIDYFN